MIEKEFVPYQESLELKQLRFDEPCLAKYNVPGELITTGCYSDSSIIHLIIQQNDICEAHTLAPTFSQAFRWFREKYNLWQIVMQNTDIDWTYDILPINGVHDYKLIDVFKTYEEAELACLKKLIEIVKK